MLTISRKSIIGKIYSYWQRLNGEIHTQDQENLCHFVTVIFFRTWWDAFWKQPIIFSWLRPWIIVSLFFLINLSVLVPVIIYASLAIIAIAIVVFIVTKLLSLLWRYKLILIATLVLIHVAIFIRSNPLFWTIILIELFSAIILSIYIFWENIVEFPMKIKKIISQFLKKLCLRIEFVEQI